MNDISKIQKQMNVLALDGKHVGSVEKIEDEDKIKLTRKDRAAHEGHGHFVPLSWVVRVDNHVHLSKTSQEVFASWEHVG
jgi:hypothetical protein